MLLLNCVLKQFGHKIVHMITFVEPWLPSHNIGKGGSCPLARTDILFFLFHIPCQQDVSKLITSLIPQTLLSLTHHIHAHTHNNEINHASPRECSIWILVSHPQEWIGHTILNGIIPTKRCITWCQINIQYCVAESTPSKRQSIDTHVWTKDICRTYCKSEGPVQNAKEEECPREGNHCLSPTKVVLSSWWWNVQCSRWIWKIAEKMQNPDDNWWVQIFLCYRFFGVRSCNCINCRVWNISWPWQEHTARFIRA